MDLGNVNYLTMPLPGAENGASQQLVLPPPVTESSASQQLVLPPPGAETSASQQVVSPPISTQISVSQQVSTSNDETKNTTIKVETPNTMVTSTTNQSSNMSDTKYNIMSQPVTTNLNPVTPTAQQVSATYSSSMNNYDYNRMNAYTMQQQSIVNMNQTNSYNQMANRMPQT